jgi:multiple sugar transport system substrate-binding protein
MHVSKKLSRRDFLRVSALGAAGVTLAACAAPAAQAPAAPAATTAPAADAPAEAAPTTAPAAGGAGVVQYWFGWGNIEPALKTFIAMPEFQETLGGATLDYKTVEVGPALVTALAAGTPPDGAANIDYVQYMAKDQFMPVADYVKASTVIKQDDFIEAAWQNGFWKGVQYGVPGIEHFVVYGLNYNKDIVEKAGLDPNAPPTTWGEALEWHKKLTTFDSAGNIKTIGLDPYDAMAGETDFTGISFGFQPFDENTSKHDFNNPAMIESLKVMGEFYKVIGPDKMVAMRGVEGQGGWGAAFNAGIQSMIIEGYWHPGETVVQKPEVAQFNTTAWAPVSDARSGKKIQGIGGHFLPIFVGAKNPEGAFKLAEWFSTDMAADVMWKEVGWLPPRKSYVGKVKSDEYPGLKFYLDSVNEATDWTPNFRRSPIHGYIQSQYQELRESVYRDNMSAEDAAAELQKRVDTEWKNQGY